VSGNPDAPYVSTDTDGLLERLKAAGRVRLFLDYDGTLAEFAPTPDDILPDPELIDLITRLGQHPRLLVSVISGRRLSHILDLLPVPGVLLAGTYGVELQHAAGEREDRVDFDRIRPVLEELKPRWQALIEGLDGFYLEDKGWALGIHGRRADAGEADRVLDAAERMLDEIKALTEFRILGGYKFIEIGPQLAHKGRTIEELLARFPFPDSALVYLGDDDKDEEAFEVIRAHGGEAVLVSPQPRPTHANYRLESPAAARRWLASLLSSY
jgi:trehalose 6-phosphate phosphatase